MRAIRRVAIAGAVLALSANSWAEPATSLDFLSFEDYALAWTSSGSIGLNDDATDGLQSLAVTGCGWMELNSPQFATSLLPAVEESITFDFFVPENQPNPWWIGDVGVLISIPSAGIYHNWIGQQLLTSAERGVWVEGEVALPTHIQQALEGDAADVTLHLVVNTSSCTEPLLIDNIRFAEDGPYPISDDFGPETDLGSHWRFLDPLGDSSYVMTGSQAVLQLPGGTEHDLWTVNKNAIRLLQAAPDEDFGIEVGFESTPSQKIQAQGIIVQQTDNAFLRFGMFSDGKKLTLFSAFVDGSDVTGFLSAAESHGVVPLYTRVERAGDDWSYSYSEDGVTWVNAVMFTHPMTVTEVGLYAINAANDPAYDAVIDYFSNLAAPVTDAD